MPNNIEDHLNFAFLIDSHSFKIWEIKTIERLCASKKKSAISVIECYGHGNIPSDEKNYKIIEQKLTLFDRVAIKLYRTIDKTRHFKEKTIDKDYVCKKYNILYNIKGTLTNNELMIDGKVNDRLKKINVIIDFRLLLNSATLTPFKLSHGIWFHKIGYNNNSLSLLSEVLSMVGKVGLSIRSYSPLTGDVSSLFTTSIRPHSVSLRKTEQYIYCKLPSLFEFASDKHFCGL
jgi:hypothetical protein